MVYKWGGDSYGLEEEVTVEDDLVVEELGLEEEVAVEDDLVVEDLEVEEPDAEAFESSSGSVAPLTEEGEIFVASVPWGHPSGKLETKSAAPAPVREPKLRHVLSTDPPPGWTSSVDPSSGKTNYINAKSEY